MIAEDVRQAYFGTLMRPLSFNAWLADIGAALQAGRRGRLLGHHNLHSLYLRHRDPGVAAFYRRCENCYVDGMPVTGVLTAFGMPTSPGERFSFMDHFADLLLHAEKNDWQLYYLGSRAEVVKRAETRLRSEYPDLRITLSHGYFDDPAEVIADINARRPDLLLVGMGMPRQEYWLRDHLQVLDVGCATQAGATLDYFTGEQARPPIWLSRMGLAWLYRLLHDPRRLWRRYLLEPWTLLGITLRYWLRWLRP